MTFPMQINPDEGSKVEGDSSPEYQPAAFYSSKQVDAVVKTAGWSGDTRAVEVMDALTRGAVAESGSQNEYNGMFWERGREQADGSITFSIYTMEGARKGSFKIEADGTLTRAPGWVKKLIEQGQRTAVKDPGVFSTMIAARAQQHLAKLDYESIQVGDRVSYQDMANPRREGEVVDLIGGPTSQFEVQWDDGEVTTSDLRQHGWNKVSNLAEVGDKGGTCPDCGKKGTEVGRTKRNPGAYDEKMRGPVGKPKVYYKCENAKCKTQPEWAEEPSPRVSNRVEAAYNMPGIRLRRTSQDEEDEEEGPPSEEETYEGYVIQQGSGAGTSVFHEGRELGSWEDYDEATRAIVADMEAAQSWPGVWEVNDHGNISEVIIQPDGTSEFGRGWV